MLDPFGFQVSLLLGCLGVSLPGMGGWHTYRRLRPCVLRQSEANALVIVTYLAFDETWRTLWGSVLRKAISEVDERCCGSRRWFGRRLAIFELFPIFENRRPAWIDRVSTQAVLVNLPHPSVYIS